MAGAPVGPTGGELLFLLVLFACIAGAAFIGLEHLALWLWHHVSISWGAK